MEADEEVDLCLELDDGVVLGLGLVEELLVGLGEFDLCVELRVEGIVEALSLVELVLELRKLRGSLGEFELVGADHVVHLADAGLEDLGLFGGVLELVADAQKDLSLGLLHGRLDARLEDKLRLLQALALGQLLAHALGSPLGHALLSRRLRLAALLGRALRLLLARRRSPQAWLHGLLVLARLLLQLAPPPPSLQVSVAVERLQILVARPHPALTLRLLLLEQLLLRLLEIFLVLRQDVHQTLNLVI